MSLDKYPFTVALWILWLNVFKVIFIDRKAPILIVKIYIQLFKIWYSHVYIFNRKFN